MIGYHRARSLTEALAIRAERDVALLAGGTDIYPAFATRRAWGDPRHKDVLDISSLDDLRGISEQGDHWRLGALTTWTELARAKLPPLFDGYRSAAREVGGAQVQNRGTLAGNICTASPAGDGIPCLLALDARVELNSVRGVRAIPIADFNTGYRATALAPDEIVTALLVPKPARPALGGFRKLGARRYLVISIVMVAGVVELEADGSIAAARLAVGSCSAAAQRLPALEAALVGVPLGRAAEMVSAAQLAGLAPIDDIRSTAGHRLASAEALLRDLLGALASTRAEAA